MNMERAAMKGHLAELQQAQRNLTLKGTGLCNAIRQGLNPNLASVTDMDIPQHAQQMDELVMAWAELAKIGGDIARLERELN
jgi:hypothetical protein